MSAVNVTDIKDVADGHKSVEQVGEFVQWLQGNIDQRIPVMHWHCERRLPGLNQLRRLRRIKRKPSADRYKQDVWSAKDFHF